MRDSFVFYKSFFDAINDVDEKTQLQLYRAICELSINNKKIELTGLASTLFKLIVPQLEANNTKFQNGVKGKEYGKRGGRPKKEVENLDEKLATTKEEKSETPVLNKSKNPKVKKLKTPVGLFTETPVGISEKTPNVNVNVNANVNDNVNGNLKGDCKGGKNFSPCLPPDQTKTVDACFATMNSKQELFENAQASTSEQTTKFYLDNADSSHKFPDNTQKSVNKKRAKKAYGSAKNVFLTDEQHAKLSADYGDKLPAMVEYLSNYIAIHGKKYKDHNLVLRDWVENAVRKKELESEELDVRRNRLKTGFLYPNSEKHHKLAETSDNPDDWR